MIKEGILRKVNSMIKQGISRIVNNVIKGGILQYYKRRYITLREQYDK